MNIGKLLKKVGTFAKENPEVALAVVGIASPKLVRKAVVLAPVVIAALGKKRQVESEDAAGA